MNMAEDKKIKHFVSIAGDITVEDSDIGLAGVNSKLVDIYNKLDDILIALKK